MAQLVGSSRSTQDCRLSATEKTVIRCSSSYSHGGLTAGRLDAGEVDAPGKRPKKDTTSKKAQHYAQVRIRKIKPQKGN